MDVFDPIIGVLVCVFICVLICNLICVRWMCSILSSLYPTSWCGLGLRV
jgi:hypothetical protein